jgi:hypothetical protein
VLLGVVLGVGLGVVLGVLVRGVRGVRVDNKSAGEVEVNFVEGSG